LVNPSAEKHKETLSNIYYFSLLRRFAIEIEKKNSLLIILGSSLRDIHISNLIGQALEINPTLIVLVFFHNESELSESEFRNSKHQNLYIVKGIDWTLSDLAEYMKFSLISNKENTEANDDQ
jgi:hypothetical protein